MSFGRLEGEWLQKGLWGAGVSGEGGGERVGGWG